MSLSNKVCPHCGKSYYTVGPSMSTCVYCPSVYEDGKLVSSDANEVTTILHCLNCGNDFTVSSRDKEDTLLAAEPVEGKYTVETDISWLNENTSINS